MATGEGRVEIQVVKTLLGLRIKIWVQISVTDLTNL